MASAARANDRQPVGPNVPGQPEQQRSHEDLEGHEGRGRIARKAQHRLEAMAPGQEAEPDGAARAHADPPEAGAVPELVEHALHQIGLTHGGAADRDQHVRVIGAQEAGAEVVRVVSGGQRARAASPRWR
jgi:hypothetical protein